MESGSEATHSVMPMEQYPISVHQLVADQYSLMSPIGPAASQTWRFGRGKFFTSDYCFMLKDIGRWFVSFFEMGMPWVASYAALEANDKNESRGYLYPAHEVHRIRVGPLWAGPDAEVQTRELGRIWDARGAEYYDSNPAPIGIEFYGRRDLPYLVVESCLDYLRDHGGRAYRFMTEEWIIHYQARTDVPVDDLEVGTEKFTLMDFLKANIANIERQLTETTEILATWYRTNPEGHRTKEIRDGEFSLFDVEQNRLVNFRDRLGTTGVAAGDYTALKRAADYFQNHEGMAEDVARWRHIADELRRNTLRRFWINGDGYFGMAIEKDPDTPYGDWRLVKTRGSGPFEMMEGEFLIGLPEEEYRTYLASIVRDARSSSFLTDAGYRMVAAEHAGAFDYHDYQWSTHAWVLTAGRIGNGFWRHHMPRLAMDSYRRPTNASALGGRVLEFFIVPVGKEPYYLYAPASERKDDSPSGEVLVAPNDPEGGQGFSNSVILRGAMMTYFPLPQLTQTPTAFHQQLEEESLRRAPMVPLVTLSEIAKRQPTLPVCYVDMEEAKVRAKTVRQKNARYIHPIRTGDPELV